MTYVVRGMGEAWEGGGSGPADPSTISGYADLALAGDIDKIVARVPISSAMFKELNAAVLSGRPALVTLRVAAEGSEPTRSASAL